MYISSSGDWIERANFCANPKDTLLIEGQYQSTHYRPQSAQCLLYSHRRTPLDQHKIDNNYSMYTLSWPFIRNSIVEYAVCKMLSFSLAYGRNSRSPWLRHWQPLVMESLNRSQWCSQSLLLFPPPGANEGDWMCWNAKNAKGMPSTMYGVFCLTTSSSIHDL